MLCWDSKKTFLYMHTHKSIKCVLENKIHCNHFAQRIHSSQLKGQNATFVFQDTVKAAKTDLKQKMYTNESINAWKVTMDYTEIL